MFTFHLLKTTSLALVKVSMTNTKNSFAKLMRNNILNSVAVERRWDKWDFWWAKKFFSNKIKWNLHFHQPWEIILTIIFTSLRRLFNYKDYWQRNILQKQIMRKNVYVVSPSFQGCSSHNFPNHATFMYPYETRPP